MKKNIIFIIGFIVVLGIIGYIISLLTVPPGIPGF